MSAPQTTAEAPMTTEPVDETIRAAARWLADLPNHTGRAIVPEMKTRFGITALQAVTAIREANLLRARAH